MDQIQEKNLSQMITMDPIENLYDITRIREYLASRPRDLLLFELAINTGLEMVLLLELRVGDVKHLEVGQTKSIVSSTTAKSGLLTMVDSVRRALDFYLAAFSPEEDDCLFKSRKGPGPISASSASHLISGWLKAIGLKQRGGALVLRKTYRHHFSNNQSERFPKQSSGLRGIALEPVAEQKTLQEIVYRRLFQAIVQGKIPPGERIVIEHLAHELKVSRIPVREALHRLEAIGLIARYKRGLTVAQLSFDDYKGLTEVRLILETKATELAAQFRDEEELEALERYHCQFIESLNQYDVDAHIKYNRLFHHTIYRAARRPILYQIIESLWHRVSPYIYFMVRDEKIKTPDFHSGILAAIKRGDPKEAGRWMWTDIEKGTEVVANYLEMFSPRVDKKSS